MTFIGLAATVGAAWAEPPAAEAAEVVEGRLDASLDDGGGDGGTARGDRDDRARCRGRGGRDAG